jgi:uncharacterized protein (DUF2147 family)
MPQGIARIMLGLVALIATTTGAAAGDGDAAIGTWRNIRNTMHIEILHCGDSMCGKVVWASDQATADAKRGGTRDLIGTEIFRDFRRDAAGNWRGKVFVPDLNKTFSGTIELVDRNTLKGTGCLIGRVLCKSKVLVRIG